MQTTQAALLVKMSVAAWDSQNKYFSNFVETVSEEQLQKEIAPGRNTGVYLVGHLIAVSDAILPLLGWGNKLFPELEEVFIKQPDKSGLPKPTVAELKDQLTAVNKKLSEHIQATSIDEWLDRHMAVSPEDFAKEPHRNRLNVLINRTNHMANHIGQLLLLKEKN